MADKLGVFNGALFMLGSRRLSSLTEDREPRRVLDRRWEAVVERCLADGQWKFAMRAVESEASDSVEPPFGYAYAHQRPADFIRLVGISANENFNPPLSDYVEEAGYWYAHLDPIYVRYTSNGDAYGWNIGEWPRMFADYVEAELAFEICERLTDSSTKLKEMAAIRDQRRLAARNLDAMSEGAKFRPMGSWASARLGRGPRQPRGNGGWTV